MRNGCVWTAVGLAAMLSACEMTNEGDGVTAQAVAGPSVTLSTALAHQINVSWVAVDGAFKYYVYQSTGGPDGLFIFVANPLSPILSYSATGLTAGASYCYEVVAAFPDGSNSDPSSAVCAEATSSPTCTRVSHTRKISPFAGQNIGSGIFQTQAANFGGIWQPEVDGDVLAVNITAEAGERIDAVTAQLFGALSWTVHEELWALDGPDAVPVSLGAFDTTRIATPQPAPITTAEEIDTAPRSYFVQFTAHNTGLGFHPRVGPITVQTSTCESGCL